VHEPRLREDPRQPVGRSDGEQLISTTRLELAGGVGERLQQVVEEVREAPTRSFAYCARSARPPAQRSGATIE
jgi:hypothetical protein